MIFKFINLDQISKKVGVIENKEIGDVHDVSHGTLYYVGQGWKNEKTSKETTGNQLRAEKQKEGCSGIQNQTNKTESILIEKKISDWYSENP